MQSFLFVTCCSSCAAFNIPSLALIFAILITMCLAVVFFLFGTLCSRMPISFPRLAKCSASMSSDVFSAPFSLSSPPGTPKIQMFLCLMWFQRSLKPSSFLFILYFFCSASVISSILSPSSLIIASVSSHLPLKCIFHFTYCTLQICLVLL